MKDIGIFTLLTVIVSAAAPASPEYNRSAPFAAQEYSPAKSFVTAKSTERFANCFANSQDNAGLPWSFVPKESGGGTFSNLGARSGASAYFVVVSDRGSRREIRLEGTGGSEVAVNRAISQCV
jgi:hypothetical protein